VGTDLVYVPRLATQIEELGAAFLDRVFTPAELADCGGRVEALAARWAAKEAVLKALGWELQDVALTDIEVIGPGRPRVLVPGYDLDVSLSHDGDYALAVVVVA
jgi:holo-[acyl-carrier protein] synthase